MGTLERRKREKQNREAEIISAAEEVFFKRGFDASSMSEIAKQAELSKGSLYNYFTCKNELCVAIVRRTLSLLLEAFNKTVHSGKTGCEQLNIIIETFILFSKENQNYYRSMQHYRQHRCGCGSESCVVDETVALNQEITQLIYSAVELGKGEKSIRADIDSKKVAVALWGDLTGLLPSILLIEEYSSTEEYSAVELFRYHCDIFLNGLKN
jgi:AcrR family transcriptional regulator